MRSTFSKVKAWFVSKLSNYWRWTVSVRIPLGVAVLVVALVALIILGPELHVEHLGVSRGSENFAELANKYRATYAQIIGGVLFLLGLYLGWQRLEVARESQIIEREGQITERFTRAIDQLGSKSVEIRLGGIYALERIARDSEKDHWTVMEVLTAFLRERSPWSEEKAKEEPKLLPTDIQAVLTVIGRRKWIQKETHRLDLTWTDLRMAELDSAHLEKSRLVGVHMEGALLVHVHLERAYLGHAHLEGAVLVGAHLEAALLNDAYMEGALLTGAYLEGTHLSKTRLGGAELSDAIGLTREQIESAITDEKTKLPDYLKKPPEKEQK